MEAVTEPIVSWADASEEVQAPVTSEHDTAALAPAKEGEKQIQDVRTLGAVISTIGEGGR